MRALHACAQWSVGCIFGELLRQRPLFPATNELEALRMMGELLGAPSPRIWPVRGGPGQRVWCQPRAWCGIRLGGALALHVADTCVANTGRYRAWGGVGHGIRTEGAPTPHLAWVGNGRQAVLPGFKPLQGVQTACSALWTLAMAP